MRKIFFYISMLEGGGAERVIANISTEFAENNYDVSLVTTIRTENEYAVGEKVKRFVLEETPSNKNVLLRNIDRICALRRLLQQHQPDVLISFLTEANFRAIMAAQGLKVKTIISLRNDPVMLYDGKWWAPFIRWMFNRADGVVFQTRDAQTWFSEAVQKKSRIILNQVHPVFYQKERVQSPKNIVTVCGLRERKNLTGLIRAFSKISDKVEDNLLVYGIGPLQETLETQIQELGLKDRVYLKGGEKNVADRLAEAKAFILSSNQEGMPNALMEALAVGLPCVSTDCPCGGPKMLIEDGVNGLLVPVGDEDKMAEAMLRILSDDAFAQSLAAEAKKRAKEYSPQQLFPRWRAYVEEVAAGLN